MPSKRAWLAAGWILLFCACSDSVRSRDEPDAGTPTPTPAATPVPTDMGCLDDTDCVEGRCDVDTGDCVDCLDSTDCAPCETCEEGRCDALAAHCCEDNDCIAGEFCSEHFVCVECELDGDCRACERCDSNIGRCELLPDRCCEDADCASDCQRCTLDGESGRCETREDRCCEDADCGPELSPRCDPESFVCGPCTGDADCEACRRCDVDSGACVAAEDRCCDDSQCAGDPSAPVCGPDARCAPCGQDADCAAGRCVEGQCQVCRADADCALGGRCDATSGRCMQPAGCGQDRDCGGAATCEGGRCADCTDDGGCQDGQRCQAGRCAEAATCDGDLACLGGRLCEEGACVDAGCVDDRLEDDDRPVSATLVTAGVLEGLVLCPNDDDYFAIPVEDGSTVRFRMRFDPNVADLVPVLYFADGGTLVGDPLDDGRVIEVDAIDADRLFRGHALMGVTGFAQSAPYDLEVEIAPPETCDDDPREEDDSADAATEVPANGRIGGVLCDGDQDWLSLELAAGQTLSSELLPFAPGRWRLTLWQAGEERVLADGAPSGARWALTWTNETEAPQRVAVEISGGRGPYELDLSAE